jgi:hypothetical protein
MPSSSHAMSGSMPHHDPVRPRPGRVAGGEQYVATTTHHVRYDQPEPFVVVPDCRGQAPPPVAAFCTSSWPWRTAMWVNSSKCSQVPAVEDRDAREVLERRVGEVVVLTDADDAGVGMEARDQGISHGTPMRASTGSACISAGAEEVLHGEPLDSGEAVSLGAGRFSVVVLQGGSVFQQLLVGLAIIECRLS